MLCKNCAADFPSDQLKCPYCGTVNEYALNLAKNLQVYDKEYEKTRDEMLKTGGSLVLRNITIGLGLTFLIISVLFGSYVGITNYRYNSNSGYQTSGSRYIKNKELVDKYMKNGDYFRAYALAAGTDPTTEYFESYPEYKDELNAIYNYFLIFWEVANSMEEMDKGNNYRSFTPNQAISYEIFYGVPETAVKAELQEELELYLKNYYCLTEAEIKDLRHCITSDDFVMDGRADYETVSKERMVERFGK